MMGIIFTSKWKQEIISGLSHISNFVRKIFLLLITHLCVWSRDVFGVIFSLSLSLSLSLTHNYRSKHIVCLRERTPKRTFAFTHIESKLFCSKRTSASLLRNSQVCVWGKQSVCERQKNSSALKSVCV